jgi:CBS domain containing-hemolysin-like protein
MIFIYISLLLLINSCLVAGELSLIKLRFSHFNPSVLDWLRTRRGLAHFLDRPEMTSRTIRLAVSSCSIGYAILFYLVVSRWIFEHSGLGRDPFLIGLSGAAAFVMAVILHFIVGEMIPRFVGLNQPLTVLRILSWVMPVVSLLLWPINVLLKLPIGIICRFFKVDRFQGLDLLDYEAQLELMGEHPVQFSQTGMQIIRNALQLRELVVSDIILPRNQVKYLDLNDSLQDNLELARKSGHTRFPLCDGDLDKCIGLIHIKDLFRFRGDLQRIDLRKFKREIIRLDPEEPIEGALQKLLAHKMHMALVIDEFRGTEGVLTLERILEQLVGDIQDEFDADEALIRQVSNTEYIVSGLAALHEVEDVFGLEFKNQDVASFGGLITSEIGRIPERGEILQVDQLNIRILEVDGKRIISTSVSRDAVSL